MTKGPKRLAEEVVYINTQNDSKYFIPFTRGSKKRLRINTNKTLESLKEILDIDDIKVSDNFLIKANNSLDKLMLSSKSDKEKESINELKNNLVSKAVDNQFYEDDFFTPNKELTELSKRKIDFTPGSTTSPTVKDLEEELEAKIKSHLTTLEPQVEDGLFGLLENYRTAFDTIGYPEKERITISNYAKGLTKDEAVKLLTSINSSKSVIDTAILTGTASVPLPLPPQATPQATPALADPLAAVPAAVQQPTPAQPTAAPLATQQEPQQTATQQEPQTATQLPFIKRYHPESLLIYFGNSSYPAFDKTLESSVMSLKTSVVKMMDDIINNFSTKIFVYERLSDTLEEFNELIQLQFKYKNIKVSTGSATGTVKLADLVKLDRDANSSSQTNSSVKIINPQPVSDIRTNVMTSDEDQFIRNYDNYLTRKNLNMNYSPMRIIPEQKITGYDPRNIGIIKGNNLESIKSLKIDRVRRI